MSSVCLPSHTKKVRFVIRYVNVRLHYKMPSRNTPTSEVKSQLSNHSFFPERSLAAMGIASPTILLFLVSSSAVLFLPGIHSQPFSETLSEKDLGLPAAVKEKLTHLHFYFHDIISGSNPTAIRVAAAATTNASKTAFGEVMVVDDPLTEGPEMSSKLVGRTQGMYASSSLTEVSLIMAMNYVFVEGKYNGSTLSILGRNSVYLETREMPVVGGSGAFRFARGFAQARTHILDLKNGVVVEEHNVYVLHC